jgi:Tol biopolymer transport system component
MKSQKRIARIFSLTLTLVGLLSWNLLPVNSPAQAARAATPGGLAAPTGQAAPRAVANGRIAFVSDGDVYTMNPDGSDRLRLTLNPAGESSSSLAWSPDGTQLAFQRNKPFDQSKQSAQAGIFVMQADGSNQRRLSPAGEVDYAPAWSPDGTQLAFVRNVLEGVDHHNQIFVMEADGSNQRRLTQAGESNDSPVWSPDGTKIAFLRLSDFAPHLVVMNADGSGQRIISQSYTQPAWSPDGSKLAFASYDSNSIFVIHADGSNPTQITQPAIYDAFDVEYDSSPSWSPDGSKITFSRYLGCDIEGANCHGAQIRVVNADGSGLSKAKDNAPSVYAYQPTWSPDSTKVIFLEAKDLFLMNADGSGLTNLTHTVDENDYAAAWQPLPLVSCADGISAAGQSFEADGGTGGVEVSAGSECHWTASSNFSWVSITAADNAGNGSVSYAVAANPDTHTRSATIIVAAQVFRITQAGVAVRITKAEVAGKTLVVTGEHFDAGAEILLNGAAQKTRNDAENPTGTLIGKKAGKKIRPGDRLQVRNPDGALSQEFSFSGS